MRLAGEADVSTFRRGVAELLHVDADAAVSSDDIVT